MKTQTAALLATAAIAVAACTTPKEIFPPMHPHWADQQSRQSRHYVDFPGKARQRMTENKTVGNQTASTYLRELELNGRYYGTAWTLIPNAPQAVDAKNRVLELAAAEAVKSTGGKLVSKHDVVNEGVSGLTYVVDLPQSKSRMRQQIFIVTDVLVEQTYTGPAGTEMEREPGRFFDSLKLLP